MNGSSHPESRVSTISRRFASKVLSMIEKYESLSHTTIHDQAPQPAESNFRRLGKSVLARARLLFENAAADQRTNQRTVPPKRRFLKFKKRRMRGTKNGSNGFDYDGAISSDGNSNTPSEMETETSSDLTVSTPPVARILPSSFFKKLAAVKEPVVERKPEPRGVKWRRRRVSPRMGSVRLDMSRRESNFAEIRRRIVPPKVSVRDLKERFQEAERACTHKELKMEEMDGSSRMRARRKILNKGKGVSKNSVRRNVMSGGVDKSFKRFEKDQKLGYIDSSSDFFYDDFDSKEGLQQSKIESSRLACRDDMNYLNTEYHCMADGSLSNFGYFLLRLESEAETFDSGSANESMNENDSFIDPVPSTELASGTGSKKMYRKTPPPSGFFLHAEHNSNLEENISINGMSVEEPSPVHLSRPLDIVSPRPMNAVQAAQLRSMVFRYT